MVPSLQLYPNPARDGITIVSTHPVRRISLFNLLGQRISDLDNTALRNPVYVNLRLHTMSLPSGSYFLAAFDGDELVTIRFKIEK